jgi:hypothetical protein
MPSPHAKLESRIPIHLSPPSIRVLNEPAENRLAQRLPKFDAANVVGDPAHGAFGCLQSVELHPDALTDRFRWNRFASLRGSFEDAHAIAANPGAVYSYPQ